MAIDHAGDDIRVNCIMPGPVWIPRIASDEAGWTTGVTLPVDRGVLLTRGGDRPGMV